MFEITKTKSPGRCRAKRCTAPPVDVLCAAHQREWEELGRPPLVYAPPQSTGGASGAAVLDDAKQEALVAMRGSAQECLQLVCALPLDTHERRVVAKEYADLAHAEAKRLRSELREIIDPLKGSVKRIQHLFEPVIDTYDAVKRHILESLAAKMLELEQARDAALVQIEQNAGVAPAEAFLAAHAHVQAPGTTVEAYDYAVIDASLLPDAFWVRTINHAALRAHVNANGESNVPSGVSVTRTLSIRAGGRP